MIVCLNEINLEILGERGREREKKIENEIAQQILKIYLVEYV